MDIGKPTPNASLAALSRRLLGCDPFFAGCVMAAQLWLGLLWFFYQGFGIVRGIILAGLLVGLVGLRLWLPRWQASGLAGATSLTTTLRVLLFAIVLLDLGMMAVSTTISIATSKIPMDEGQTSWRAARLLWDGEDPYARGALVDFGAWRSRMPQRLSAGLSSGSAGPAQASALARYDVTLDNHLRTRLLPLPENETQAAARESRLYGYKYGPIILLATALVAPFHLPAAVLLLNGLVCFAFFAVNWRILRRVAGSQLALAGVAMLALLLDRHITRNYIDRSATDIWALLFGSLAVLAFLSRRPLATAACVALAVGCKSMPGLLFLPLLFRFRSLVPFLAFAALAGAIFLPWLVWDPGGLVNNVFLWPFYMATDPTSWEFFAPPWVSLAARAAGLVALTVLWLRYLSGREPRLFWVLATSSTIVLLASGYLRNGYVPWASVWMVIAIVEAFAGNTNAREAVPARTAAYRPVPAIPE